MINFETTEELLAYIKNTCEGVLLNEGLDIVKGVMEETLEENVYDVYDPEYYGRRLSGGGLKDKKNIVIDKHERTNDRISVGIINDTKPYNKFHETGVLAGLSLAEVIEEGRNKWGIYDEPREFANPRPFIEPSTEIIRDNQLIEKAIERKLNG